MKKKTQKILIASWENKTEGKQSDKHQISHQQYWVADNNIFKVSGENYIDI